MATQNSTLTQEQAKYFFEYKDGNLYSKQKRGTNVWEGKKLGKPRLDGYCKLTINGTKYYVHRIIFLMFYGYMPEQIDHIDGNPSNNKVENLRETNYTTNNYNKKIMTNNKYGIKGVNWHKTGKKWRVEVCVNKKRLYLGLYDDVELAELVAIEARNKYHKEFARHI